MSNVDPPPYLPGVTADVRAVLNQPIVVPISIDSLIVSYIDLGQFVPLGHLSLFPESVIVTTSNIFRFRICNCGQIEHN